ncbi:MAG: isocitrate lyase/phosphoenolpyruvate mutase family protein [Neomegalonema sp.]|nr:isocitrate lyase/phosphoenolpyruvate mutase family protein [Neomegalonema sp.]
MSATAKREVFARLHQREGAFIMPNPWDIGTARMLAGRGAEALATTSAGLAFTHGLPDGGSITIAQSVAHAKELDDATAVPVSADLENGGGATPEDAADAVKAAVDAGLAGCSIEDVAYDGAGEAYGFDLAVARIRAAVQASADARIEGFQLTARADGGMAGAYDLEEAVKRLQAFEAAGADVLYTPMPPDPDALKKICAAVKKPVNALAAGTFLELTRRDFISLGVKRISIGSSLARAAQAAIDKIACAMLDHGDFGMMIGGMASADSDTLLAKGTRR